MKKKILVLGYFGYKNNQLDGQTIKTRSIFELLKQNVSEIDMTVDYFDTQTFKKSKLSILKSWLTILKCNVLFYLPAHNSLKYLFPFIFLICKIKRIDIHYVVVGGWLNEFIKDLPIHTKLLSKIKGIYPQSKHLADDLRKNYSLKNVVQLHNFRFYNEFEKKNSLNGNLKLVFMARIHPKKGVLTLFKLAENLPKEEKDIRIDLYGQIQDDFRQEFNDLLNSKKGNINYYGVLNPDEITNTLKEYDLFLFPTEFYTEGFPGSVLDAYIAEVPVMVTKWKYAEEFVKDNESGMICEFGNSDDFIKKTLSLVNNEEKLKELNNQVKREKEKYSAKSAWIVLKRNILSKKL